MPFRRSKSTLEYPPYARFQPQAIGQSTWLEMTEVYSHLIQNPTQRLKLIGLISRLGMGTDLDVFSQRLAQAEPLRTLRLYQKMNPKIDLANLAMEDPYEIVAGLAYLFGD